MTEISSIPVNIILQKRYKTIQSFTRSFICKSGYICQISFCFGKGVHKFIYDCQRWGVNGLIFNFVFIFICGDSCFETLCINNSIIVRRFIVFWTVQTFQWRRANFITRIFFFIVMIVFLSFLSLFSASIRLFKSFNWSAIIWLSAAELMSFHSTVKIYPSFLRWAKYVVRQNIDETSVNISLLLFSTANLRPRRLKK